MKLPVNKPDIVFGHMLSLLDPAILNADKLREHLLFFKAQGFGGMTIVVPLVKNAGITPKETAQIFEETDMMATCCGFLPGAEYNTYTPDGQKKALNAINDQAQYPKEIHVIGRCDRVLHGPIDSGWRLPADCWSQGGYEAWLQMLHGWMIGNNFTLTFEALNEHESIVPDAFNTLYNVISQLRRTETAGLYMQWGTMHARLRNMSLEDFLKMIHLIRILELENVGRWPLDCSRGVPFEVYRKHMHLLHPLTQLLVESFSLEVVKAFVLGHFCTTTVPGEQTVIRDAEYLKLKGWLARVQNQRPLEGPSHDGG